MTVAVGQNGMALQYASEELSNEREVVTVAVKQNGMALQYASPALLADFEVAQSAVEQNAAAVHVEIQPLYALLQKIYSWMLTSKVLFADSFKPEQCELFLQVVASDQAEELNRQQQRQRGEKVRGWLDAQRLGKSVAVIFA